MEATEALYPAVALLIGLAAGALVAYRVMAMRLRDALDNEYMHTSLEIDHRQELIAEREQALTEAKSEIARLRTALMTLLKQKGHLAGRAERVEVLEQQAGERERALRTLRERLAAEQAQVSTLQTRLEEQQKQNAERLAQLEQARERMTTEFENLANRILEEKSQRFSDQNRAQLGELLSPVREQLDGFRRKVEEIHVSDERERGSLREQINQLRELNQRINQEAVNLTRALKGDKKAQGNWGELVLERVLEQSGLRKGVEYETQSSFRDAGGRLLRPDVVIHLPDDKDVVVDSKVSLMAYHDYVNTDAEEERERYLREHVKAVRAHIDGLSAKDYSALPGLRSLDFVLLFMPLEAAFVAAFQADDRLFSDAFERRIVVVTPTTLLATLRTIENLWRHERQNENARLIAERAGALYDKLRGFAEDLERVGAQFAGAHDAYDAAMDKLCRGRGNLIGQAERLRALGVKVRKEMPRGIMERTELDADEAAQTPAILEQHVE